MSRLVGIAAALLLAFPAILGQAAQTDPPPSVVTPFYTAEFANGQLLLRDPVSGTTILEEQAPELCLGGTLVDPTELMPNGSLEALNPSGGPIGWDIYRPYISVANARATDGTNTLDWRLDAPDDPNGRGVDTPAVAVSGGERYVLEFDWSGVKHSGSQAYVSLAWYPDRDGMTQRNVEFLRSMLAVVPAGSPRSEHEWMQVVVPPQAQSMRLLFRAGPDLTGSFQLGRVSVRHVVCPRPDGSPAVVTSSRRDAATTDVVSELGWGDARIRRTWQLSRVKPVIQMRTDVTYANPTYVTSERLRFVAPDAAGARTLGHDMRLAPLTRSVGVVGDALSPRLLDVPGKFLVRADGAQSTLAWGDGSTAVLNLYADQDLNHPLALYERGRDGHQSDVSQTFRKAGETSSLDLQIVVGQHPEPVALARQPNGYEATLAISEHADGANLDTSNAVNFGTSDESDPLFGRRGLIGNGIRYTKSVFVFPTPFDSSATLQSEPYAAHVRRLAQAGIEIVPHTISDGTDDRARTQAGLDILTQFGTRNWIDHGDGDGINNLEAIASQGLLNNSEFRISDLLAIYGYRYSWSDIDYEVLSDSINLLASAEAWKSRPLAFSISRDDGQLAIPRDFLFWSTAIPRPDPEVYLSPANITRLVSERGVYLSHDYFPRARYEGHLFNTSGGVVTISDVFETDLEAIAAAQQSGRLWVPTISELLDYWTVLDRLRIVEQGGGVYRVVNGGDRGIDGLTMMVGADVQTALVGGQPAALDDQKLRLPPIGALGAVEITLQ